MATVPTVPNIVPLPRAQDGSIEFWWNPPTSDGGSAITGYTVSCSSPQLQTVLPASAFNTWVQGLTNGQNYTFFITASNAVGESAPATWQPYQPGFIPSPPTGVGAVQQPTTCNFVVSRSTPTTSTNTVNYWSVQATPADIGFSTIVQAEYGSNLTTVLSNLDTTQTQWQMSARQLTDPGWSDPARTPYIGNNRVRTAFVTNSGFSRTVYSSNGDMYIIGNILNLTQSTILFNSRGNEVQRIPPQPVFSGYIMYSSADGVTNTWLSLINGAPVGFSTDTNPGGQVDSNGNLIFALNITSALYHRILDKNGTTILSNSTPNPGSAVPYVLKCSSNGIYTGSNDSNTWAALISTPNVLSAVGINLGSDTTGSIFLGFQVINNAGGVTSKTITFLDRLGNSIGNTITIPYAAGATNSTQYHFAKYNTNGLAANSWNAFWSNDVPAAVIYNYCAKVNSANELVVSFRFRGANSYIYDANRSTIGGVLPYLSTPGFANLDTCLVKFGTTGTSNDSWRAVIRSESANLNAYKDDTPLSTTIDSSNNILVTGFSEFFTTGANLIPFDKNDTSNVSVTQSTFSAYNMFVTRYTNSGTPEWITTLGGASTIGAPSTIIGVGAGNSGSAYQLITTAMDSKNNMYIAGNYNSNSLVLRNKNGVQQGFISSPRSNFDVFLAKISADGTTGALARLGSVSTVNSFTNINWRMIIDPNDTLYLSGTYGANLFGFYPSSNALSPSMFISSYTASGSYNNSYVAKIHNGLSTISLGRYQTSNGYAGVGIQYPAYLSYDSFYNPILIHETNLPTDQVGVFAMGNHTSTPDYVVNNSNSVEQIYRTTTTATTRFTTNPTTSWTALQIAGNTSVLGAASNIDQVASFILPRWGSIFVDSNDRIFTSIFTSSATSTIIFDGTRSTIVVPQQIIGPSIVASSISMMLSYPINGINRLQ